jgi:hypothetical protein
MLSARFEVEAGKCLQSSPQHPRLTKSTYACRLQWLNIIRELEAGSLTLRNEEVHTLLTQAAWQLGPQSSEGMVREWHEDLNHSNFRSLLYEVCSNILLSVRANWRECVTVQCLSEQAGICIMM